jgi:hypothetical protein
MFLGLDVLAATLLIVELAIPVLREKPKFPITRWILGRLLSVGKSKGSLVEQSNARLVSARKRLEAAKAKWDQETIKAKAVTEAEQERDVVRLNKETAELTKATLIAEGEGEAKKKQLIMAADGALAQKIDKEIQVAKIWADAYSKQRPTPDIVFGGTSNSSSNDLGAMLMFNAAKSAGLLGK